MIDLRDSEHHQALISILESWGTSHDNEDMLPSIINNKSGQGKDRVGMRCIVEDDAVHFSVSNHDVCSISFNNGSISTWQCVLCYQPDFDLSIS